MEFQRKDRQMETDGGASAWRVGLAVGITLFAVSVSRPAIAAVDIEYQYDLLSQQIQPPKEAQRNRFEQTIHLYAKNQVTVGSHAPNGPKQPFPLVFGKQQSVMAGSLGLTVTERGGQLVVKHDSQGVHAEIIIATDGAKSCELIKLRMRFDTARDLGGGLFRTADGRTVRFWMENSECKISHQTSG